MQYPASSPAKRLSRFRLVPVLATLLLAGCDQVAFQKADSSILEWESLRGEWVLVNYWAEWCKPCLEEIPELNALDGHPQVTVLGVNFDGIQGVDLVALGERMGIGFPMLAEDPGPEFGWKLPVALPATFVVDPDGNLLEARFGPQTEDDLKELMGL